MAQHFAHLSDPHLSTLEGTSPGALLNKRALGYLSWRRKRRFEHRTEVLDALQEDLRSQSQEQPLDQLLVTGDLTHIGLPAEFQQARAWLENLGTARDIALVPGNHDACVMAPWSDTFALWADYMAADSGPAPAAPEDFPSLRIRGEIAFIGVNTGVPKPPLMATGTAGASQLERLLKLLVDTGKRQLFRVVHLHHCPLPEKEKWRKRLTDAAQLQESLTQAGAELIVHGHGHRRHQFALETSAGAAPVISVPSASALGLHGADLAEYNRYSVSRNEQGWRLGITRRAYDRQTRVFSEASQETVDLPRS